MKQSFYLVVFIDRDISIRRVYSISFGDQTENIENQTLNMKIAESTEFQPKLTEIFIDQSLSSLLLN